MTVGEPHQSLLRDFDVSDLKQSLDLTRCCTRLPIKPNPAEQGTPDRSTWATAVHCPHGIDDVLRGAKADDCRMNSRVRQRELY